MSASDYPLGEPLFVRKSLSIGILTAVYTFLPSIVSLGTLYAVLQAYGVRLNDNSYALLGVIVLALCIIVMQPARNVATQLTTSNFAMAAEIVARWLGVIFVLLILGYLIKTSEDFSRLILVSWAVSTPILIVAASLGLRATMRQMLLDVSNARQVVFAGCNEASISLAQRIATNPELCMKVSGFFDDRSLDRLGNPRDIQLLGGLADLGNYVKQQGIGVIFVALPIRHLQRVMTLLDDLRDTTASIYYVPDIFVFDLIQARTGDIMGIPVVSMCETPFYGFRGVSKRIFDIVVSCTALLLLLPLLVLIAVLVKFSSPGRVLFKQRRYGLDGEEIMVYKFRTMTVTEDGAQIRQATIDDERTTLIGRFLRRYSLDELPQLINVIQGRMSLVGPRPHAVAHNEQYRKLIKGYMVRHKVPPGITGLAQVNGLRGETKTIEQMEARVHYDLEYLRHWSILLDFKILARTAWKMFSDAKAY